MKLSSFLLASSVPTLAWALRKPAVRTGFDVLRASNYTQLAGRKVIVLTNPTGITPELDLGVDVMFGSGLVEIQAVCGPEHGFRGTAPAGGSEGTFTDPQTGLTVYVSDISIHTYDTFAKKSQNAYNANISTLVRYISESGADTVLYDIQDVGARFYTCQSLLEKEGHII